MAYDLIYENSLEEVEEEEEYYETDSIEEEEEEEYELELEEEEEELEMNQTPLSSHQQSTKKVYSFPKSSSTLSPTNPIPSSSSSSIDHPTTTTSSSSFLSFFCYFPLVILCFAILWVYLNQMEEQFYS